VPLGSGEGIPASGRMHRAAGGAPRGNRNALKHGARSAKCSPGKMELRLSRLARETLEAIN